MTQVCPADVAALLRADVQAVLRRSWTDQDEHRSPAPAPSLQPVPAQLAARGFPKHARNAERKVALCDSWTMSKPS
eukprot:723451-Pyramimonas_sp.AAC.1